MNIRTRFAPSPTGGDLHIGNLYTVLINWTVAHQNNGRFILRIEDTDQERLIAGSEDRILKSLTNYHLLPDEGPGKGGEFGPYRQSERLDIYKKYAQELIENMSAYYCFCSKEKLEELRKKETDTQTRKKHFEYCNSNLEEAKKRIELREKFVIRLKVPENEDITFDDLIRGPITINTDQIDDQVLLKSDGFPTYHLAVVIDDHLMQISHVVRAEEWISSTPKHVLLYQAFGWQMPIHAHTPILRNPDRSKLSKRKNPVWASWYLEQGFLSEAVLNFLSLMGWSHPEGKEIFSLDEFIQKFDLTKISPVGPAFDVTKLEWMNGEYIRAMSDDNLTQKLIDFLPKKYNSEKIKLLTPLVKERIKKFADFIPLAEFIFNKPRFKKEIFDKIKIDNKVKTLEKIAETMDQLEQPWEAQRFEETFRKLAQDLNIPAREIFQLIRVAVSGKLITPPLNESIQILGTDEVMERVKLADQFLQP